MTNLEEKKKKLDEVFNILKSEFIGLDKILDEIKLSISPWYFTPELINRPVVVSLWGMTGTGKTSVVKRLVELLDYKDKALFFDCGLEAGENTGISNNISSSIIEKIGVDDFSGNANNLFNDLIFVFDEFQYARTIDESGIELLKSPLRPIWSIIDEGLINFDESNNYEVTKLLSYYEFGKLFISNYKIDPAVKNGYFASNEDLKKIKEFIGLRRYYSSGMVSNKESEDGDEDNEEHSSIPVLDDYYLSGFVKKLNNKKDCLGFEMLDKINNCTRYSEILSIIDDYKKIALSPRELDCSKSLVFILGNLDEAFGVEKDLNPDFDANVFKEITEKVTISDIKNALLKRFRAEQIARFGNNIIKYPTLNRRTVFKPNSKDER